MMMDMKMSNDENDPLSPTCPRCVCVWVSWLIDSQVILTDLPFSLLCVNTSVILRDERGNQHTWILYHTHTHTDTLKSSDHIIGIFQVSSCS